MNNVKVRFAFYISALVLIIGLAYWRLHQYAKEKDSQIETTVLPAQDQDKLLIDNQRHIVTIVDGSVKGKAPVITRQYLNPRGVTSIEESKSGTIKVTSRQFGTEYKPFVGATFGSDIKLRGALGLDLVYYRNVDAGLGVLFASSFNDTRLFAKASYNVYSNIQLGLGIDNRKEVHLVVTLAL